LNTVGASRYAPEWLALRERADAQARAQQLLTPLRTFLADAPAPGGVLTVRDLGCGTGSMGRWLAEQLGGPQRWYMYDRDPLLLEEIGGRMPQSATDGSPIEVVPVQRDITDLSSDELAGTSLVVASALLDVLTAEEVERIAASCAEAGCAVLMAISVEGKVEFDPADPLDAEFAAAFNAHQRRNDDGRRLLGPDAVEAATAAFELCGATVRTHSSPWELGADDKDLTEQWLRGWTAAACAQQPDLEKASEDYLRRRLEASEAGELRVVVHHRDLLALPGGPAEVAPV
jgi:hypothetical protein